MDEQKRGAVEIRNLFSDLPKDMPQEVSEVILETETFRKERILSRGHSSPEGFWFDQERDELVFLLKGRAGLKFRGRTGLITLKPGDYIRIPAHVEHRVAWTDPDQETIWLAVHYDKGGS